MSVAPDIVRSVHGDTSHAQAGSASLSSRSILINATVSPPPALSPPSPICAAAMPCCRRKRQAAPRVLAVGREGSRAHKPIANCQRSHPGGPACLGYHAPVAEDRTGAIATAMEKHQNASVIAAWNNRPLSRYAAEVDRSDLHVLGYGPNGTDLVEALSPLGPTNRSRL